MEDGQIVQLYWDRDESAILATAEKYGAYCLRITSNILINAEDAQECVNDTYLNAWNAIPPHRPSVLSTFLGKIARNIAFNRYKHNAADKRGGGEIADVLDELEECISGIDYVEQEINRKELIKDINAFLETLPQKKCELFLCRYWYAVSV